MLLSHLTPSFLGQRTMLSKTNSGLAGMGVCVVPQGSMEVRTPQKAASKELTSLGAAPPLGCIQPHSGSLVRLRCAMCPAGDPRNAIETWQRR